MGRYGLSMRDRSQVLSVALACLSMWVADASGYKLSRASADMGSAGPPLRKKSRIEISMSRRPAKECLQDAARSSEERKTLPWPAHNAMAPAAWKARSPIGRRTLRRSHAHRCSDVPIMQLFNPTHETTAGWRITEHGARQPAAWTDPSCFRKCHRSNPSHAPV